VAFVPPPLLNPLLSGDRVEAEVERGDDGRWTVVQAKLLERAREELFGEVVTHRGRLYLRPDREVGNTDRELSRGALKLQHGDLVVARVEGTQTVALRKLDADADVVLERLLARHAIATEFPPAVERGLPVVLSRPHALGHRRDLREVPTITVDAASTRDIDDAVSVLPAGADGALRLLVSIADVGEFVPEGDALDLAARARATSVYLAGRVVPMLPEALSSGWLSLLPGEDRCCLTAELRIDPEGCVTAVDVYESLLRSWGRVTYEEMAAFLDTGQVASSLAPLRAQLPWFRTASARLGLARSRRGGVTLSREETRVVLDATGAATGVSSERPNSAHTLIERFMVAANEALAAWLVDRGLPALLRVHDPPTAEKTEALAQSAMHFGFAAGFGGALSPLALTAFDAQLVGAPCEPALRSVLLRILGPARYTVERRGHFGLAAPLYLHFTSPIRRYADLAVHRLVKRYLHGDRGFTHDDPAVEHLGRHINARARAAARAETERRRCLLAQYMASRVGEVFSGHVTGVRPFGLVVQLDTSLVEGTLALERLPGGPFTPDARGTAVQGPGGRYETGMAVTVKLVSADPELGRIGFELVPAEAPQGSA
jgi:ribonuclease R